MLIARWAGSRVLGSAGAGHRRHHRQSCCSAADASHGWVSSLGSAPRCPVEGSPAQGQHRGVPWRGLQLGVGAEASRAGVCSSGSAPGAGQGPREGWDVLSYRCRVGSYEMLCPPHTRIAASKAPTHPHPCPQQGKHQPCNVCRRRLWNRPLVAGIVLNVPPWFLDQGAGSWHRS